MTVMNLRRGSCVLVSESARRISAESFEESPDGVRVLVVADDTGAEVGSWDVAAWAGDVERVESELAEIGRAGSGAVAVDDPEYGPEYAFVFDNGSALRIDAVSGSTVRLVGQGGASIGSGSLYWTSDEIAESPVEVMGGVVGAARRVGGGTGLVVS